MRQKVDDTRIRTFMERVGRDVREEARIYLVGGASSVLLGWRRETIDVDLRLEPEVPSFFANVEAWKRELDVNLELASPSDFIPELPGWRDRSIWIARIGRVDFFHYDFYAQALSKIERAFAQDRNDVESMLADGLVEPARLRELFEAITPQLPRYPAIDVDSFRSRLDGFLEGR